MLQTQTTIAGDQVPLSLSADGSCVMQDASNYERIAQIIEKYDPNERAKLKARAAALASPASAGRRGRRASGGIKPGNSPLAVRALCSVLCVLHVSCRICALLLQFRNISWSRLHNVLMVWSSTSVAPVPSESRAGELIQLRVYRAQQWCISCNQQDRRSRQWWTALQAHWTTSRRAKLPSGVCLACGVH